MSFIDLFAKVQHSSVHVQLTSSVLGGSRQKPSCLSANIVANTLNSVVNIPTHRHKPSGRGMSGLDNGGDSHKFIYSTSWHTETMHWANPSPAVTDNYKILKFRNNYYVEVTLAVCYKLHVLQRLWNFKRSHKMRKHWFNIWKRGMTMTHMLHSASRCPCSSSVASDKPQSQQQLWGLKVTWVSLKLLYFNIHSYDIQCVMIGITVFVYLLACLFSFTWNQMYAF